MLCEASQKPRKAHVRGDIMWNFQEKAERERDWWIDGSPKGRRYISCVIVLGDCRLLTDAFQLPQEIQMSRLLAFQELMVQKTLCFLLAMVCAYRQYFLL